MQEKIFFILMVFLTLLMTSCAQKVNMRALEPAQIDRVSQTKKISVTNFKNDRVGLSNKIEANLAQFQIDEKNYFTIVSRNDFEKILKEQRIQNSGLIERSKAVELGQLIGAQAIIGGNVSKPTAQDSYYYAKRSKCADKECKNLVYYKVRCQKRVVALSSEVRIVDVTKGDIIYGDTLSRSREYNHCSDDSNAIPSREMAAQSLATSMAREFTNKLTPHYKHFSVELLEDPDLEYSDKQEQLLEISLEYVEQSRYDKAEILLKRLVDSTESQSYVPFYNLGVISESRGDYKEAQEYYTYADNLMVEPVEEINEAVVRIQRLIAKREKTRAQINR